MRVRIEGAVGVVLYRNRGEGLPRSAVPRNVGPCEQSREGGHGDPLRLLPWMREACDDLRRLLRRGRRHLFPPGHKSEFGLAAGHRHPTRAEGRSAASARILHLHRRSRFQPKLTHQEVRKARDALELPAGHVPHEHVVEPNSVQDRIVHRREGSLGEQAHDVLVAPAEFRRRAADDCYRPHPCGRRRPENIKARGRERTKFYFESANADIVGIWRPQHEWQRSAISNVDGQGLSTHKCREMVWLGEPVEPQGGIEPPICALPRRRYTPKPLRQRRRPKGGRYLGLSTAIGATRSRDQSLSNARVFATSRTMKASITSFDLRVLVAEWQGLLGGHVDKIYQRDDEVIFRINVPDRGKVELYLKAGQWLCLHEVEDKPESPPPFAQTLRRLLDNARVTAVEQRGLDRIAIFRVERGPERFDIVFEVFSRGNLVLVRDAVIVAVMFPQKFKDRDVQVGERYSYPVSGIDSLDLDRDGFAKALQSAKGQVVRILATVLNLGGTYAEELCLRAAVDKETRVKDLQDRQIDSLYTALNNIAVAIDQEGRPAVILQEGRAIDATPIELWQNREQERREFPTFNEALSHFLTIAEPQVEVRDDVAAKFERRIAQQRETLQKLREEAMLLEAQAVFLYGHYAVLDELLRSIREGRPPSEHGQIKAIDRKTHMVTVAVGDFEAITLDYDVDVTANAQAFYDRRKDAQLKAQRVEEAIAKTREEMDAAKAKAVKAAKKPRIKATKAMWFEAYRWTFSADGLLILGGRDARTNDQLVKKHLKEGDRYAHADIHGAPSTVIKDGARAPETTLREACEFALAYSKAWSAGLASGSAYWVLPEQVSKQAESGEFLPRGAFVVRGKRNYFHDLPVRLAIGEVEMEGQRKILGGPGSAG